MYLNYRIDTNGVPDCFRRLIGLLVESRYVNPTGTCSKRPFKIFTFNLKHTGNLTLFPKSRRTELRKPNQPVSSNINIANIAFDAATFYQRIRGSKKIIPAALTEFLVP